MLRISVINEPDSTKLKLEGKLAHDWVAELRTAWEFTCTLAPAQSQTVDLAAVSFVDEAGRELLSDMHVAGVKLVGSGPMMTALIEEITCPPDPKKWLRKGILVLLFLAACLGAPKLFSQERNSAEVMSLEQAIAIAKKSNRQVMIEQLEALKATDEVAIAKTKRLPSINTDIYGSTLLAPISFEFEKGAFGDFPTTGPIPNKNTQVTADRSLNLFANAQVKQPLSQLYRINLGIKAKDLLARASNQEVRKAEQGLIRDVRKTYYTILQLQEAMTSNRAAVASLIEMQRVMATRLAEQSVLPADTLEVKASLARAQQQQIVIADNIALAKEQLNLLLGRDPETLFEVAPVEALLPVESDLLAARARAIENRPELKQADLKARAAEYDRRVKKAERLPDVGGFVSYLSPFNIDVVPRNVAAAGIQVTWEPFDWGRKKIELSGKTRAVEQARLVAQHTRDAVLVEVNDAFRRLREANAQVQVAQIDQEAAQERLRVLKNQLEQKAALVSDVLALERKVAEAQYHKQEAMVAFWNAKADFAKAIGEE